MTPAVRIEADGADITALIEDRLLSLSISDAAGTDSDTAEIELDDRGYRIALPEPGAELVIWMGYRETGLVEMGTFVVDECSGQGPASTLTIHAKAADMRGGIKAPKTQAWEDKTLGEIVDTIAARHGLRAAVAPALRAVRWAYVAQTKESDLHFLSRLAIDLDATVKPAGGALVVVPKGEGVTADGAPIPEVELSAAALSDWSWTATGRSRYASAVAEWSEPGTATVHRVETGSGEPVLELRRRYATEDEARRAAEAALKRAVRASGSLSATCTGFAGELMAEGVVILSGIKPELTGRWTMPRVSHRFDAGGLTTSFEAERDNEDENAPGGTAETAPPAAPERPDTAGLPADPDVVGPQ